MAYPKLEYKYLFRSDQIDAIRRRLAGMCALDPHAERSGRGEYVIRSIYFDTHDLQAYEEKVEGVKYRRKFRIRVYENCAEDSIAFLEIKRKVGVLLTKYRAPVRYADLEPFFDSRDIERYVRKKGGDGVDKEHARRFLFHYYRSGLKPIILITYDREAFVGIQNPDLRLTLDKNLRSFLHPGLRDMYREDVLTSAMHGYGIFEVKFTQGVPRWLRSIIHEFSLKRMALSKYTICLDAQSRSSFRHSPAASFPISMDAGSRSTSSIISVP